MSQNLHYELPVELIAEKPLAKRDHSRLMVVDRESGDINHQSFSDILELIQKGDCLVLNNTKVLKARLFGQSDSEKEVELLLVEKEKDGNWLAMVKRSRKIKEGTRVRFGSYVASIGERSEDYRRVRFEPELTYEGTTKIGLTPIPPYIVKKREKMQIPEQLEEDDEWYQTVFARYYGSVAAPTASLHFTKELLDKLDTKGVKRIEVTLHVGPGTFKPIEEDIETYQIHREWIEVNEEAVRSLKEVRQNGGRIVAVGTTVARTLETMASVAEDWASYRGYTRLFIKPGFHFQVVDRLITNFHMPHSSLLLLVRAFGGEDLLKKAYKTAIREQYRFYSYGDAMLIR